MITIKSKEIVKLEDVLNLYPGCRLDKIIQINLRCWSRPVCSLAIYVVLDGDAVVGLIRFGWRWIFISTGSGSQSFYQSISAKGLVVS